MSTSLKKNYGQGDNYQIQQPGLPIVWYSFIQMGIAWALYSSLWVLESSLE